MKLKTLITLLISSVFSHGQTTPAKNDGSNITNAAQWRTNLSVPPATGGTLTNATFAGTVTIPDGALSIADITMGTGKLLGRSTASTGSIQEITLGTNLSFSGTTLNATGGDTVDNAAVNAAIATDPTATLHTVGAPRVQRAALNRVSFLGSATRRTATLHTRGISFGDSIFQNGREFLWSTIGFGGRIVAGRGSQHYRCL
jgi:hypothetical protein